ncbi:MAG: hypothetical protein ACRDJU_00935, partial [Actinomycetota bacterium]
AESYADDISSGNTGDQQAASSAGLAFAAKAEEARARGLAPASPEAAAAVGPLLADYAAALGKQEGPEFREWFLGMVDVFCDRDAERYWQLLAVINGWKPMPAMVPAWEWAAETVRAHQGRPA